MTRTESPPRTTETTRWRTSVYIIFSVTGFGLASWVSRVPSVRDALHASSLQMGFLALGIAVGSVLGFLAAGRLGPRLTPRRLITSSLILSVAGILAVGIGSSGLGSYPIVLVGLTMLGLGNGTCNVTMNVEGAAVEHAHGRPIMSWFHAAFSIGAAIGAGLGAAAAALGVGVGVHLAIAGCLILVLTLVASRQLRGFMPEPARTAAADDTPRGGLARIRQSAWFERRTILIGLTVLGVSFANGSANDWMALAMVDGHGVSDAVAAMTVDAYVIALVTARLFGVSILARFGRVRTVQASALLAAIGITLFIVVPSPATAVAGAICWGLGAALGFPVGMSAASDDPIGASARISVVATVGYAGLLVGPPAVGFLAEHVGQLNALFLILIFVIIAGLAAPVLRRTNE